MLFRKYNGDLIEVNITEFFTDSDYYKNIMRLKEPNPVNPSPTQTFF